MTNEEAIRILRNNKPSTFMKEGKVFDMVANVCMATDMAIQALGKQKVGKWHMYRCSECKTVCTDFIRGNYVIVRRPNYCPYCGAKMEVEE